MNRQRPVWDAPVNSPTPQVFLVTVLAIVALIGGVFGALELVEWIGGRWGAVIQGPRSSAIERPVVNRGVGSSTLPVGSTR